MRVNISKVLFRFRRLVLILIFVLGFWAPLDRIGGARPGTTWLFLSGLLASHHILPIAYSSIFVMGLAILLAVIAALLRTWAAAYLGRGVIQGKELHWERIVADGPYRHLRNPLYVGLWLHACAVAILMPPGGAVFALAATMLLIAVLVHAEEHRLTVSRGEVYIAYMRQVPRFLYAIAPRVAPGVERPDWKNGFLSEIYMWGVVITYIAFAGRYNAMILVQGILISLGISIIIRGALRPVAPQVQ